ncbi:MAG: MoxR family ATPase [Anaerolineae bacterium]|nr:MoxR family ATPase [Anaerolineae bacterium]
MSTESQIQSFRTTYAALRGEIAKVIVGHDEIVAHTLIALFAGGHVLLEGVPGLGKTLLIRTLSEVLDLGFNRIQFTPDLMPADILGTNLVMESDSGRREFQFQRGPIFAHLILADEINRATPKTQSAMLEAMQEKQVTAGGELRKLSEPFFVMATQNPIDQEGTYPLPEAQVDRFMLKVTVDYPQRDEERVIIERMSGDPLPPARPVVTPELILQAQQTVRHIYVDSKINDYVLDLVFTTRFPGQYGLRELESLIAVGASPRAGINLIAAARAHAFMRGRGFVTPEDIKQIAPDVLRHRIITTYEAEAENISSDHIVQRILDYTEVP